MIATAGFELFAAIVMFKFLKPDPEKVGCFIEEEVDTS
jgi:hypothetical protein